MTGKQSRPHVPEGELPAPISDLRFAAQQLDPRFQRVPNKLRKIRVDERFKAMFDSTSKFARKSVTDKYGRPVKHDIKEDLSKFYDFEEEEEASDARSDGEGDGETEDIHQEGKQKEQKSRKGIGAGKDEIRATKKGAASTVDAGKDQGKKKKKKASVAPEHAADSSDPDAGKDDIKPPKQSTANKKPVGTEVRGSAAKRDKDVKGNKFSDPVSKRLKDQDLRTAMMNWSGSSSSESEGGSDKDMEGSDDEMVDISQPIVPIKEYVPKGGETRRLAALGMDWERVKAVDILVLFRSFAPSTGQVFDVKIYVSEFGKQRLEQERHCGPGAFIANSDSDGAYCVVPLGIQISAIQFRIQPFSLLLWASDPRAFRHWHPVICWGAGDKSDREKDAEEFDPIKLRRYEADKLRYYYAIVECDSVRTAMGIYEQVTATLKRFACAIGSCRRKHWMAVAAAC